MNIRLILEFLTDLEQNNSRDWFHANRDRYQTAKREFEALVGELLTELRASDGSLPLFDPGELTFKLQRDTRFSNDKSPYNPAFRAHIGPKGKLPVPVGYFLMIRPGGRSFLGGGLFSDVFRDATAMIRDKISACGEDWARIVSVPDFREHFSVRGAALKKAPKGYDPDHSQVEYLKFKSWYLEYPVDDDRLTKGGLVQYCAGIFQKMAPFNAFLNDALKDFQMPAR